MDEPKTLLEGVAVANLLARFLVEVATLVAVAWSSYHLAPGPWSGVLMALLAPFALSVVWGAFVAPKASRRLGRAPRLSVELLVFGSGVAGLWLVGNPGASVVLGTVAMLSLLITHTVRSPWQEGGDKRG